MNEDQIIGHVEIFLWGFLFGCIVPSIVIISMVFVVMVG